MTRLLTDLQIERTLMLAKKAAKHIMNFYKSDYEVSIKKDKTLVTQADLAANNILSKGLLSIANYPILSEENIPQKFAWINWHTYWLIDPIDGTEQFINSKKEFCICIALIDRKKVVFGLIYEPITNTAWFAQKNDNYINKYYNSNIHKLKITRPSSRTSMKVVLGSISKKIDYLFNDLGNYQYYKRNSALKFIDIIEGKALLYPKISNISEWDIAAGQCLLECAGGKVICFDTKKSLRYGYKKSLISPHFLAYRCLGKQELQLLFRNYKDMQIGFNN